mmetsp:Transcript_13080/g.14701  ORF Transcript_13080/g.14701 Transcript_13080/m.14701 type:complete len:113 (+) Transcript_13080:171-509(+)
MKKIHNELSCENPKLLEAVFGDFLETLAVHFDGIFELLVEDLLTDEVNNLNQIENRKYQDLMASSKQEETSAKTVKKKSTEVPTRKSAFMNAKRKNNTAKPKGKSKSKTRVK